MPPVMQHVKAKRRGQVVLARAMVGRNHCVADVAAAVKVESSTIARILDGERGVGTDVAARIADEYPEVYMRAWTEPPDAGDDIVPEVPRGKPGPRPASANDSRPPEAA